MVGIARKTNDAMVDVGQFPTMVDVEKPHQSETFWTKQKKKATAMPHLSSITGP